MPEVIPFGIYGMHSPSLLLLLLLSKQTNGILNNEIVQKMLTISINEKLINFFPFVFLYFHSSHKQHIECLYALYKEYTYQRALFR